jgi:hypothetical protein
MRNLLVILIFTIVSILVTFTSCKKDEDENDSQVSGTAVIDGSTVSFTKGYLVNFGMWEEGIYNFDITLVSEGIDFMNETGTGDLINFKLQTSSENFQGGTFTYNSNAGINTFNYVELIINGNWENQTASHSYVAINGTLSISLSDGTYNINFSFMGQEMDLTNYVDPIGSPKSITGSFSGPLTPISMSSY